MSNENKVHSITITITDPGEGQNLMVATDFSPSTKENRLTPVAAAVFTLLGVTPENLESALTKGQLN